MSVVKAYNKRIAQPVQLGEWVKAKFQEWKNNKAVNEYIVCQYHGLDQNDPVVALVTVYYRDGSVRQGRHVEADSILPFDGKFKYNEDDIVTLDKEQIDTRHVGRADRIIARWFNTAGTPYYAIVAEELFERYGSDKSVFLNDDSMLVRNVDEDEILKKLDDWNDPEPVIASVQWHSKGDEWVIGKTKFGVRVVGSYLGEVKGSNDEVYITVYYGMYTPSSDVHIATDIKPFVEQFKYKEGDVVIIDSARLDLGKDEGKPYRIISRWFNNTGEPVYGFVKESVFEQYGDAESIIVNNTSLIRHCDELDIANKLDEWSDPEPVIAKKAQWHPKMGEWIQTEHADFFYGKKLVGQFDGYKYNSSVGISYFVDGVHRNYTEAPLSSIKPYSQEIKFEAGEEVYYLPSLTIVGLLTITGNYVYDTNGKVILECINSEGRKQWYAQEYMQRHREEPGDMVLAKRG